MSNLAQQTTRAASWQTYYTIAMLVERRRREDAYRAYAYFRWVDDWLDGADRPAAERMGFVERQRALVERSYAGEVPFPTSTEERMVVDLIRSDPDPRSSLGVYVDNMLSVMAFDAERRGRLISQAELAAYQRHLAVAVTEAMYYFVGCDEAGPRTPQRYLSVTAAHITHMLRDTYDDLRAGYFNVPAEFLRQHNLTALDVGSPRYRQWVKMRVGLAREDFRLGRRYLESIGSARCRVAAQSYAARFETVLSLIEADGYRLRPNYGACKTFQAGLRMAGSVFLASLGIVPVGRLIAGPHRDGASDT